MLGSPVAPSSSALPVVLRPACRGDLPRIAELIHSDPGPEAIALLGGAANARRCGLALARRDPLNKRGLSTVVVECSGQIVAVLQCSSGRDDVARLRSISRQLFVIIATLGPVRGLRALRRMRARARVALPPPRDSLHIKSIDVAKAFRNRGIGASLLQWAYDKAVSEGRERVSLNATLSNPARHLYERSGFKTVRAAIDGEYWRLTGIPGRILMEKTTSPS
jgi:ribosomal protein S18 acetylase RimI-like enzyme